MLLYFAFCLLLFYSWSFVFVELLGPCSDSGILWSLIHVIFNLSSLMLPYGYLVEMFPVSWFMFSCFRPFWLIFLCLFHFLCCHVEQDSSWFRALFYSCFTLKDSFPFMASWYQFYFLFMCVITFTCVSFSNQPRFLKKSSLTWMKWITSKDAFLLGQSSCFCWSLTEKCGLQKSKAGIVSIFGCDCFKIHLWKHESIH